MAKTFLDLQNLRVSKIEATASKILDVDLARFYNEVVADMSKYGQKLKKVTTNIVANQGDYTISVLPGLIATSLVKIGGQAAPFVQMASYDYELDRSRYSHTIINGALSILPVPTSAATNGLVVWYWAKLPEIVDAAVAGTSLADLDDRDWNVVILGVTQKMFEKLVITAAITLESIPDGSMEKIIKVAEYFGKMYQEALNQYGNQSQVLNKSENLKGAAARENEMPLGIGRQDK